MEFELPPEYQMIKDTVQRFVRDELLPLEPGVLAREAKEGICKLTTKEKEVLLEKCKNLGLWGLDVPKEYDGMNLSSVAMVGINEAIGTTPVPFTFPPDSPNLHMLKETVNEIQKQKYLIPYAKGETVSAIAISEPGAGSDPSSMVTKAVKDGTDWVINGRKIWISRVDEADFTILVAVTDPEKGTRGGMSSFIIEKDTPGFIVEREIPLIGGASNFELVLEDCRIPSSQLLGEEGKGFAAMQNRLVIRRLQMAAWCVGMAERALQMMIEQANQRETFGVKLAERQTIQWWVADAVTKIHALKLMVMDAAYKQDKGLDIRTEASMVKVYGTDMATEIIDNAMQSYGAMGVTKELPLQLMAANVRTMRIYEGPDEIHKWVVARKYLNQ
tara:strand:- start:3734 stop:4894 length:1161 start_codon:yes stop_codon:yes gene_type:complete